VAAARLPKDCKHLYLRSAVCETPVYIKMNLYCENAQCQSRMNNKTGTLVAEDGGEHTRPPSCRYTTWMGFLCYIYWAELAES
jgi:hypothetical protein